jgi:hypothetical protein
MEGGVMKKILMSLVFLLFAGTLSHAEQPLVTDSSLGEITVSCVTSDARQFPFEGVKDNAFVAPKHRFAISVPSTERWEINASPRTAESLYEVPVLILSTKIIAGFKASVTVFLEPLGKDVSIESYVDASVFHLRKSGRNVLAAKVDDGTSAGYAESTVTERGLSLSTVQRFIVRDGTAYVVTANSLMGEETPPEIKADLREIMNSFRLLTGTAGRTVLLKTL